MRRVRDIMTMGVVSLSKEMPLARAAALFDEHQISGGPVCTEDGQVIGVLTRADLTEVFAKSKGRCVADAMTPEALSVGADAPIDDAIRMTAFEGVHRLVVLDDRGALAGIVSAMDVLRELAGFTAERGRVIAVAPPAEEWRGPATGSRGGAETQR